MKKCVCGHYHCPTCYNQLPDDIYKCGCGEEWADQKAFFKYCESIKPIEIDPWELVGESDRETEEPGK